MKNMNLISDECLVLVVDMQERLASVMGDWDATMNKTKLLIEGASLLNVDVAVTEQYPKGLGHTVAELAAAMPEKSAVIEKSSFSCFGALEFTNHLRGKNARTLVVCGVETHVCVLQTVRDAIARGYDVVLAADAVTSRNAFDKQIAFEFMRENGAQIRTVESILFDWLRDSTHPQFKTISRLVR